MNAATDMVGTGNVAPTAATPCCSPCRGRVGRSFPGRSQVVAVMDERSASIGRAVAGLGKMFPLQTPPICSSAYRAPAASHSSLSNVVAEHRDSQGRPMHRQRASCVCPTMTFAQRSGGLTRSSEFRGSIFAGPCDPGNPCARSDSCPCRGLQHRMDGRSRWSIVRKRFERVATPVGKCGDRTVEKGALTVHRAALTVTVFGHRMNRRSPMIDGGQAGLIDVPNLSPSRPRQVAAPARNREKTLLECERWP